LGIQGIHWRRAWQIQAIENIRGIPQLARSIGREDDDVGRMAFELGSLVSRQTPDSLDALIAGATSRNRLDSGDGKSGSSLERVVIDGESLVLKVMHPDADWIARALGDLGCWPVQVWTSGLLDAVPPQIDHTIVGAARGLGRNGWGGALLMRDVGAWLLPEGHGKVPLEVHLGFLDHMATLHDRFWGFTDTLGLVPLAARYHLFSDAMIEAERSLGFPSDVPAIAADGWRRLADVRHPAIGPLFALRRDPTPLVTALATTPQTLVQGDWKMGNLGRQPDGRTILLDWAFPGQGPPTADLAWYVALNVERLPQSKEGTIAAYRHALEGRGIPTDGWWDRQLELALLGQMVVLGWEKALHGGPELHWWLDRAAGGLTRL
jgi:hypothetical protein